MYRRRCQERGEQYIAGTHNIVDLYHVLCMLIIIGHTQYDSQVV